MSTQTAAAQLSSEVQKFDALAHEFWDPRGAFHPLHALNPVRLQYIAQRAELSQRRVLDVGCGGGLLAEGTRARGAQVCGIDLAPAMIEVARLHAHESSAADRLSPELGRGLCRAAAPALSMLITCMELIEHVPSPAALLAAIARCCVRAVISSSPPSIATCAPSCSRSSAPNICCS
jgi:2-polyprenyl-6-hydroxyphenyl methylase/3-demethylubiquinone-9 3-methyltransferase